MYGTVAKMRVRPENVATLRGVMARQEDVPMEGYIATHVLQENDSDVVWMLAIFQDRETYDRNADDPAMHERYVEYRALLEEDPEWHDGAIDSG
ncbi:MAG TPA: antibiotic biosynthesis monooxygenase [Actinomycetota bacterium]|nr:antibiotic biosynthesis monooxygenase [Actinomycetota bacterium]